MKKIIISLLLCMLIMCGCSSGTATAFTVNGCDVEKDELLFYMNRLLDVTVSDIETQYGVSATDNGFWDTPVGDTTPLEILKSAAVEKITRIKLEFLCAQEYDIETIPINYSQQMEAWKRDNDERQRKDANGETVYGNVLRSFYTYFQDNYLSVQSSLKTALVENGIITITDNELEEYYNEYKSDLNGSFEESENVVYGWILDEKYESYIDSLESSVKISYEDMQVETSELT